VESLALSFWIRVVTSLYLTITGEGCFRNLRINRIVFPWLSRNSLSESIESILGSTGTIVRRSSTVHRDFVTSYKLYGSKGKNCKDLAVHDDL